MDFSIPTDIRTLLAELDSFIEREIKPLEAKNIRYFNHRREYERTDWEADGIPKKEWEDVLAEMRALADRAGYLRFSLPHELGGRDGSNLAMAMIREHFAQKGLGLHNDLQNESSIVGNFPIVRIIHEFGAPHHKAMLEDMITGKVGVAFGVTEPNHGSDATHMETTAKKVDGGWVINGAKRFNSGLHRAQFDIIFARTSGESGSPRGISALLVPTDAPGFEVPYFHWTFNMPTDHAEVVLKDVRVPDSALIHKEGEGLALAQHFFHENRIRQAASSMGVAQYCINEAVRYAKERVTWGEPLSKRQGVQFPLAEIHTETEMVRNLIYKTAWELDQKHHLAVSDKVAMANYRANQLACEAADLAMQIFGGIGYTRALPFEHIYRHHRRYRITEGAEQIQIRMIASHMFGMGRFSKSAS